MESTIRQIKIDSPLSAFGDLRTIELSPITQISFEYTVSNTELTTNTVAGSGAVSQADGMGVVNTGTTTGSTAQIRCATGVKYRPGMGGLNRFTALYTSGVAGTSQWVGLADADGSTADFNNGYMIGYNGDTFGVARFANDALNFTALSACDDPLDGTGASGMTLDPTKLNVFAIQYQYLGAGAIKFFVENPDNKGKLVEFHEIPYSNLFTVPSVYNPNFYVRMKADNKATTADLTIKTASFSYFVEGKTGEFQLHQPEFSSEPRTITGVTTEVAMFTIRNKTTYATKANFIQVLLKRISIAVEIGAASGLARWRLVKGATLGGTPAYSDINATDSIVEIDTAGTTVTGGRTLLSGDLAGKNDKNIESLSELDLILSPGETLTLAVLSSASSTFNASLLWKELF